MKKNLYRNLALIFFLVAVLAYFAIPAILGFSFIPLVLSLLFMLAAGFGQWRRSAAFLFSSIGRSYAFVVTALLLSLAMALAAGQLNFGAPFDFSSNRAMVLTPESLKLLDKLDKPVNISVHLGSHDPQMEKVKQLMSLYLANSGGKLNIKYINPQTDAVADGKGPRLVSPYTALVESENFRENISPISEDSINGALFRLMHPERRLVYFLNTFGEKLIQDRNQGGLSQWASDLAQRRLLALDHYWPDETPLPTEATALVLAGPKAPLGEWRENQLKEYVKNGGRLLVMADPLTINLSAEFWALFGLKYPDGLVLDPEATLIGTDDSFVVSHDYPDHALTRGLASPTLWPITGAFIPGDNDGHTNLLTTIFAIAMSSPSSWLETDGSSFVNKNVRYQADHDIPGPLALAVAAELENGGRLLALADSDIAANGFYGFSGNRNFTSAAVNWLVDGGSLPLKIHDESQGLNLSHISARLVFWLPTVLWPALVILLWLIFYLRRHSRRLD